MGQIRVVDAISDAIVATENEIAGEAWGNEETDALDETGDRSLEGLGEGLEGQHEAEDDEDAEGSEETEGGEESEGEGEGEEGEGSEEPQGAAAKPGEEKPGEQQQQAQKPEGRIPPGKLREANERARAAEAERDQLKADLEAAKKAPGDNRTEIEGLKGQIAALTQLIQNPNRQQQQPGQTEDQAAAFEADSLFENPKGFVEHITGMLRQAVAPLQQQLAANRVETSLTIAHGKHAAVFEEAWAALNGLNKQNPEDRAIVQRIYNSPNPGEELVSWHNNAKAMREVGGDIAGYRERVAKETREALAKDPEFIKQVVASMRQDAQHGDNGAPRTVNRVPPSLARQSGSNLGSERMDHSARDDSEQAVADAAWRT